jgi:hypothetical protein
MLQGKIVSAPWWRRHRLTFHKNARCEGIAVR